MRLPPEELYSLRSLQLQAQRKALEAQEADLCLREAMLEIEQRYELLAQDATLDMQTGLITLAAQGQASDGVHARESTIEPS